MNKLNIFSKTIKSFLMISGIVLLSSCSNEVASIGAEINFNSPESLELTSSGTEITGKFTKIDGIEINGKMDIPSYEVKIGKVKIDNNTEKIEYKVSLGNATSTEESNDVIFHIKKALGPNEENGKNNIFLKDNLTTGKYNVYINSYFPLYNRKGPEVTKQIEVK